MFSKLNLTFHVDTSLAHNHLPFFITFPIFNQFLKFQQKYGARIKCKYKFLINKFKVVKFVDIKVSNNIKEGKIKAPSHNPLKIIYFFIDIVRKLHTMSPRNRKIIFFLTSKAYKVNNLILIKIGTQRFKIATKPFI